MRTLQPEPSVAPLLSRRRFVQGIAGSAMALAALRATSIGAVPRERAVLTGPDFDLTIEEVTVNYTGRDRIATAVNGQVPGPLLRMREGEAVTIRVTNRLRVRTSIHWHGMIVPADMDGVPGLSFAGIDPGRTFVYRFRVNQSGTYWYHAHSRFQEQTGLDGPIVQREPVVLDSQFAVHRYLRLAEQTAVGFHWDW